MVPMVDLVVLLVVTFAVFAGWRQGLITSALSAVGWLGGIVLGLWATPLALEAFNAVPESDLSMAIIVLAAALCLGVASAAVLGSLGQTIASRIPFHPARLLDAGLGAIAMAIVALVASWAVMTSAKPLLSADANQQLERSLSWRTLEDTVPDSTRAAVSDFNQRFADSPFPEVFSGIEPRVEVEAPDGSAAASQAVKNARQSIVKVRSSSAQCAGLSVGSGWVVSDDRVVTNAHVVAGGSDLSVQAGGTGIRLGATVVAFDSDLDLAILKVPGLDSPALPRTGDLDRGTSVAAAGYPFGGDFTVSDGRVRGQTQAAGQDVYGTDRVNREIYLLRTTISPGNSGGPLLTADGSVAGTIFAKSATNDDTGYALTDDATDSWLDSAPELTTEVSTGQCAPQPSS
ncbi:MarP family serine protease [Demetria terragena]|uniref:MarP family serine protease n=1 Tax=Demetria terragena TaxID=63959 RepID=UPI0003647164|nr:MarP family serine protease [Demetria terragena]